MTQGTKTTPAIKWDGKTWFVTLPVEDGKALEAKWEPGLTYVVRIREVGTEAWSFGFETPVPIGLKTSTRASRRSPGPGTFPTSR